MEKDKKKKKIEKTLLEVFHSSWNINIDSYIILSMFCDGVTLLILMPCNTGKNILVLQSEENESIDAQVVKQAVMQAIQNMD